MGGPVRVNGREVVTSKSNGVSIAFGDVCKVPDGGGPIPFVNVAVSADAANASRAVRINGVPVMLAGSTFARSTGDEPGEEGGIISRTQQGAAVFFNYSFDVRIEGQHVPRALDPMLHNLDPAGVPNAASPAELQAVGSVDPDLDMVCFAICYCNSAGMKMDCFRKVLATPREEWIPTCDVDPDAPLGHKSCVRYWDPHVPPGFYVEPVYQMDPKPPTPMMGSVKSQTMKDAQGEPLPLPGGDSPIMPGSRRPDVVVPLDPTKPPGPGNIKRIFEVKFPGDRPRPGQEDAYREIGAPTGRVDFVGPDNPCECEGRHKPNPQELPVPVGSRNNQKRTNVEEEPEAPGLGAPNPAAAGRMVGLVVVAAAAGAMLAGPWGAAAGAAAAALLLGPGAPGGRPVMPGEEPPREA